MSMIGSSATTIAVGCGVALAEGGAWVGRGVASATSVFAVGGVFDSSRADPLQAASATAARQSKANRVCIFDQHTQDSAAPGSLPVSYH
jgi:hypothetical protein